MPIFTIKLSLKTVRFRFENKLLSMKLSWTRSVVLCNAYTWMSDLEDDIGLTGILINILI